MREFFFAEIRKIEIKLLVISLGKLEDLFITAKVRSMVRMNELAQ